MQTFVVAGTLVWFSLVAMLWYARPNELVWLAGSLALGVAYFWAFFWYVTQRR
jgi:hypothetical protein